MANGTYKEDGTVNLETARRLGSDKVCANRPQPQPADVEEPKRAAEKFASADSGL